MVNKLLDDAEDIVLIRPTVNKRKHVYAARPSIDFKREYFNKTLANPAEAGLEAFKGDYKLDEKTGEIVNSSTFHTLRFDKSIRHLGLWVPGVLEARILDAKKRLIYDKRAYGLGVDGFQDEVEIYLIERAHEESWEYPLLASFRDLDYKINPESEYGLDVLFVKKPMALIKGEDAVKVLKWFYYMENSTNSGFEDDTYENNLYSFNLSGPNSLVGDWICGEATRKELEKVYSSMCERKINAKIKELKTTKSEQMKSFTLDLEYKTKVFNEELEGKYNYKID